MKLPPRVLAKMARRRGTAKQRALAALAQAPIGWNDRTLANLKCPKCGADLDPIHLCREPRNSEAKE